MGVEIRVARSGSELDDLFRFRHAIYKDELGALLPDARDASGELRDEYDEVAYQYGVFAEGRTVGSLRVFDLCDVRKPTALIERFHLHETVDAFGGQQICFAGRLALDRRFRNGLSLIKLMSCALGDLLERGMRLVYADSSPHLLPLYDLLGFRRCGDAFNDSTFGFKVPIVLIARDHVRMQAVRSPLLSVASRHSDDTVARAWFEAHGPHHTVGRESAALLPEGIFLELFAGRLGEDPGFRVPLLRGLSREEMNVVFRRSSFIRAAAGDYVIRAGLNENAIFIVVTGALDVFAPTAPHDPIETLSRGEGFGELAFLTESSRSADVVAREPSELVVINGEVLEHLLEKNPDLASKLMKNLASAVARRLLVTTALLAIERAELRRFRG